MLPSGAATAPKIPVDASRIAGSFSRIVCRRAASLNSFHASALRRIAAASATPCASIAFACARPIASIFAASALPFRFDRGRAAGAFLAQLLLLGLGQRDQRRPAAFGFEDRRLLRGFGAHDRGQAVGLRRLDHRGLELLLLAQDLLLLDRDQLLRPRPLDLDFFGDDRLPRRRLRERPGLARRAPSAFRSPPDTAPAGS